MLHRQARGGLRLLHHAQCHGRASFGQVDDLNERLVVETQALHALEREAEGAEVRNANGEAIVVANLRGGFRHRRGIGFDVRERVARIELLIAGGGHDPGRHSCSHRRH